MSLIEPQAIPKLSSLGRVHFIAIGGAGMSGVASAYQASGIAVSGCDQVDSDVLTGLASSGIAVSVGHHLDHLDTVDTIVVSSAVQPDNRELVEARRRGLPILHRSLALAALMAGKQVIAVAGSHGKTTTSAMLVAGLTAAGSDPSYVIGGTWLATGSGSHLGKGPHFVVEADESDGSFLQYPSTIAIITALEADHLDNWGTPQRLFAGFEQFARTATVKLVVLDTDGPQGALLAEKLADRSVVSYGEAERSALRLTKIQLDAASSTAVLVGAGWSAELRLSLPGKHNLHNAAAACAVAEALGVNRSAFLGGLANFSGTARRFQTVGEVNGVRVVDDYAHHPTEVAATLAAAQKAVGPGRVIVCFQPHLYSRTRDFAAQFGEALARADEVVVLDVYPAREDPIPGVSGQLVAEAVADQGSRVHYLPILTEAPEALRALARPGDLVLTMGAGSVTQLGPVLLELLKER